MLTKAHTINTQALWKHYGSDKIWQEMKKCVYMWGFVHLIPIGNEKWVAGYNIIYHSPHPLPPPTKQWKLWAEIFLSFYCWGKDFYFYFFIFHSWFWVAFIGSIGSHWHYRPTFSSLLKLGFNRVLFDLFDFTTK